MLVLAAKQGAQAAIQQLHSQAAEGQATNLDNGIPQAYIDTPCGKDESDMAKRIKQRVQVGNETRWVTGTNQQEVLISAAKILLESGMLGDVVSRSSPKRKLFGEYAEAWFKLYKQPKLKPTSIEGYTRFLNTHILPTFKSRYLDEITTDDIQEFYNARRDMAYTSVHIMESLLNQIFTAAVEDGYMNSNPTKSKRLSYTRKSKIREALPTEEYQDIIGNLHKLTLADRQLLALFCFTGMRRGEACGLKWEDFDADANMIHVVRNVTYPHNQPHIGTPKSRCGSRMIPIQKHLREILSPMGTSGYIVGDGKEPITLMSFRRTWQRIGKVIDLHGATPHILRHTYLTVLASTGIDVKTIQQIGGHEDIQTTMNRYVHSRTENISHAGTLMDNVISGFVTAV